VVTLDPHRDSILGLSLTSGVEMVLIDSCCGVMTLRSSWVGFRYEVRRQRWTRVGIRFKPLANVWDGLEWRGLAVYCNHKCEFEVVDGLKGNERGGRER
jgi:hypothetical protein